MTYATHIPPVIFACAFLTLFLPLLSFFLALITRERYSWSVGLNTTFLLLASAACATKVLFFFWNHEGVVMGWEWFEIAGKRIYADFLLSRASCVMLVIVSTISFFVHFYSVGYMADDKAIRRYFAMLGFFTFSMQGIVLADNLLAMFFFWELVGLSSYLLIGHWTTIPRAGSAAFKAFLFNRIGDVGFIIGLMIIWADTQTFSIHELFSAQGEWRSIATLCIFCGIVAKSAQFPLFPWLPDAMQGPTPVSALIHAATMVAAGVYLLVRIFPLFTPEALQVVAWVGMITAVTGAAAALYNFDLKRILAYSTVSQLGIMIMALGMGLVDAAFIHLISHAFFKACLFLSAGAVTHSVHMAQLRSHSHIDPQDIRKLGGLRKKLPAAFFCFVLAAASLCGIPFFSGFLSKEAILTALWMTDGILSWIMLAAMLGVSFVTVLYSFRMIWYVFMGESRNSLEVALRAPLIMRLPMIALALASLWLVVSANPFDFAGWLWPVSSQYTHIPQLTLFSAGWIFLALWASYRLFREARFDRNELLENAFYLDAAYHRSIEKLTLAAAGAAIYIDRHILDRLVHLTAYVQVTFAHVAAWIDQSLVDGVVHGFARLASGLGSFTRSFQGGRIQLYIFWSIFAIIIFLISTMD